MSSFFLKKIPAILLVAWAGWIFLKFFQSHPSYELAIFGSGKFSENFFAGVPIFSILLAIFAGGLWFFREKITLFRGIFLWIFSGVFGFLFFGFWTGFFAEISGLEAFFRIFFTWLISAAGAGFFVVFLGFSGRILLGRKIPPSPPLPSGEKTEYSFLEKVATGFAGWGIFGFLCAKLGIFHPAVFAGVVAGLLVFFWKNFRREWREISNFETSLDGREIAICAVVGAVAGLNFLQHFLPFPLGWDSMNQYWSTIRELATSGTLRTGIFPPFTEIPLGIATAFGGVGFLSFLLIFCGSGAFFSLIFLGQRVFGVSRSVAIGVAGAFFLLPAVQFELSRDLKMDLIFLQILIAATVAWRDSPRLTAFLLGFSALQKLTALWFFPIFLIAILFRKTDFRRAIFSKLTAIFLLFLPFLIFFGANFLSARHDASFSKNFILFGEKISPKIPNFKHEPQKIQKKSESTPASATPTGFREEVLRYSGFESDFFGKIWAILTSPEIPEWSRQYVDLGFFWLAMMPVFFAFFCSKKLFIEIFPWFFTAIFFSGFWLWQGAGIAWYGFPAMAILIFCAMKIATKKREILWIAIAIFGLQIALGTISRLANFAIDPVKSSISWAAFPNKKNSERLAKFFFSDEIFATKIINQSPKSKILRIGTITGFWIENLDRRVLDDNQLDTFSRIFAEKNSDLTARRLRDLGFRFILLDRGAASIELDKNGTLHKKLANFQRFAREKLKILHSGKRMILFEIPR